jgi:hypothetical protein
MPLTTRTVAKGIPPRVHMPKPTAKTDGKPRKESNGTKNKKKETKKSKKRAASDDESEDDGKQSSSSDDSAAKAKNLKKKRAGKKRRIEEPESDLVEVVDTDVEPAEVSVEEVDDGSGLKDPTEDQEVSTDHLSQYTMTYHTLG